MATDEGPPPWDHLTGTTRYAACITAARGGDRRALAALVEDLTPLVWHVARGNGLNRTAAEDAVQTVWLALMTRLDSLADPGDLMDWLIATTRREAARLSELDELDVQDDDRFWQAFAQLPQRCQELLRLTVLAGRADYEILRGGIDPSRGDCLDALREMLATGGTFPARRDRNP